MGLLLLMLCSGLFQIAASNHLRLFIRIDDSLRRCEAFRKCREMNGHLLSLYDQKDANFTKWMLRDNGTDITFWLGLHKNLNISTWSNGAKFTTQLSEQAIGHNQVCGAIANHTWKAFNCSEPKHFMCSNGSGSILVEKRKNWCQAQSHCRRHYGDLISIDGEMPREVNETRSNATFWTGLLLDSWQWNDGICSTYRDWMMITPEESYVVMTKNGMKTFGSQNTASALCSKGYRRVKVIEKRKTWEEAIKFCKREHVDMLWIEDEEDQKAVEDEIKYRRNHIKVNGPFWIGLWQSSVFGFWMWSDRIVSYNNWMKDLMPEMPLSYRCGVIDPERDFKWRDADCSRKLPFLCEEEIPSLNQIK